MELAYTYTKNRKDFGKQPMFCEVPVCLLDSVKPDVIEQRKYCLRNPVHQEIQASVSKAENVVNTKRISFQDQGANHTEGGWPKEVSFYDEELTARYRRRIERDDTYVDAVLESYPKILNYINQNNAIQMYEMFFKNMTSEQPVEKSSLRVNSAYKDPDNRPIACMGWTYEDAAKVVLAYCNKTYPQAGPLNANLSCYAWDLENPSNPCYEFLPPTACWQIACSPVLPSGIAGGLEDGRVCIFDIRAQKEAVSLSPMHLAHRDPISALLFMQSRLNTDFFTGSTDGTCKWWDIRNISCPTDSLIVSVRIPQGEQISFTNSEGVSALQYDRAFPTRFLCGTDTGMIINVNRKGKTYHEIMSAVYDAHSGPVRAVHRSPCTSKMFITCGDWTVHIWSDDVHRSPIISGTPQRHQIYDVVWAPQRYSSYLAVSNDGKLRYWDLLRKYREPILELPISKHPLLKINAHEEGRLIAIGDSKGMMYIVSLSDNLVMPGEHDKQLMFQTYEREARREHILESRVKEIRLKLKVEEDAEAAAVQETINEYELLKLAEDEYKSMVAEEMRQVGIVPVKAKGDSMRMR